MATTQDEVNHALRLVDESALPHPWGPLLSSFITEALNPAVAARYVVDKLTEGYGSGLVSDWSYIIESITSNGFTPSTPDLITRQLIAKRDGGKCCVTGKPGTFWDPLIVMPILPIPAGWIKDKPKIKDMLGAFFGAPYRNWWISYAQSPEATSPYHTHWLVRKSAGGAFASGRVRLDRLQPSMIEYELRHVDIGLESPIEVDGCFPLLGDHSRSGIEKIDARFVGTHARLSQSIRLFDVSKQIRQQNTRKPAGSHRPTRLLPSNPGKSSRVVSALMRVPRRTVFGVWCMLPSRIRIGAYDMLRRLGIYLYGRSTESTTVQRLPFGLYLKFNSDLDGLRNEFRALETVRSDTSIPVPEPLDLVSKPTDPHDSFSVPDTYLLITKVPGKPLSGCHDVLSDRDCDDVVSQLRDCVAQLRDMPQTTNQAKMICNTLGEACRDPRIHGGQPVGPFEDETTFSQELRFSDEPARRGHKIVFTHADLNPRNILVSQTARSDGTIGWIVTGIVDWETAGFYPEYWEFTKAMFEGFRWPRRYRDMVSRVFQAFGDYSAELDVETRSWESGDAV